MIKMLLAKLELNDIFNILFKKGEIIASFTPLKAK